MNASELLFNMPGPRQILVISLSRYLRGQPLREILDKNWEAYPNELPRFKNVPFDFDGNDIPTALQDLKSTIKACTWDGILIGWCIRGYPERTNLLEEVISVYTKAIRKNDAGTKLMFCTGPDNLADATLRNFPKEAQEVLQS
ncbi:conserved hypothetical protein [Talaromyces stipitatus ATCC 10500]|uniref:Uncharacterized protein n=1 Tax=Talaromyces stipitatus (strain ATCC 10500 / CBS 375.48 / QM 6759 / NRRL 1006) TaxID=441959 RepID=B8LZ02_TALSN|nr:uncharacterized protein TSTA_069310 [Talaromyces stipitatus ATCC 10500]EED23510.1 conserved hypothetical protein [Talaromyces stipitatus ATCC 10500]